MVETQRSSSSSKCPLSFSSSSLPNSKQSKFCTHKGVSKGLVVEKIFTSMAEKEKQMDFVLCIGDDRSYEDMFELIGTADSRRILPYNTEVFAYTVGQKWLVEIWVALEMVSSFVALATV